MHVHWGDAVASELSKRSVSKHVIETGTSISGVPHIGNASDVIRGDVVRKILAEGSVPAELIWVADDSDPFRKVPAGMEKVKEYLGFPVKDVPDPFGCHSSFTEHFIQPFLDDLLQFGVAPKHYSGTDLYRKGDLLAEVRTALAKRREIMEVLNQFRTTPLDDFIPWNPICEKCGRISSTKPIAVEGDTVKYVCESTQVAGGDVEGCGQEGESDIKKGYGKLPWRVEWAARWHHFQVTCEPFGKEHATVGGSYDTSKIISEKVFGWPAPYSVVYEFFTLNGEKISSSKGNIITLSDWVSIAEPEVLKFFMYKRLQKQRDINLSMLPALVDEYDESERTFFGLGADDEEGDKTKRMYQLSQVSQPQFLNIPYTLCAVLAQVVPDYKGEVLTRKVSAMGYSGFSEERLVFRVKLAGHWVRKHGPDYLMFELLDDMQSAEEYARLDDKQKECLSILSKELDKEWTAEKFHKKIYETARGAGLEPPRLFDAVYSVLIGKKKGPKAASFILSLERDFIVKRFNSL